MQEDFEFDKVVLAIALGLFAFVFCDRIGNLLYAPETELFVAGYSIEIPESTATGSVIASTELPEKLDMRSIMALASAEKGSEIFKKCAVCHTTDKEGANKVGPNLWNIVNAVAAHKKDFAYSAAMKTRGDEQKHWDYEALYRYLYAPKKFVIGTKMAFAGIKKDEDRANLIAYLRTLSDSLAPLP